MRLTLILCVLVFPYTVFSQYSFDIEQLAPMPMRTSNNAVVEGFIDNKAYVYSFGGIDETLAPSGIHNRAFRLDVVANVWEEIAPLPDPRGKIASSASRVGDTLYIIGGYYVNTNLSEESSTFVHRYDVVNNVYLSNGTDIPIPIDDQVQVVNGPLIYVITGWSNFRNVSDVQVYDTRTDSWSVATSIPANIQYPAFGASGTIVDNTIYYYGGANGSGFTSRNELRQGVISETNPLDIEWSIVPPAGRATNYRSAGTHVAGTPTWIGGAETSYNFDGIAYNGSGGVEPDNTIKSPSILSDEWIETEGELPMDLRSVANINSSDKIIAGGMKSGQQVTDETLLISFDVLMISTEDDEEKPRLIKINPNLVDDFMTISLDREFSLPLTLELKNISGQVIQKFEATAYTFTKELTELEPGVYFLSAGELGQKFVKR
jgi:hypothetical protein